MYHVYILASWTRTLYIGVTNDLAGRVAQHRSGQAGGFTACYRVHRLVHAEAFAEIQMAIQREKQLKGWLRARKIALVSAHNARWRDLGCDPPVRPG